MRVPVALAIGYANALSQGREGGSKDVFAHYSSISGRGYRSLEENQKVSFEIEQGPKGPQAQNITARSSGAAPTAACARSTSPWTRSPAASSHLPACWGRSAI